MELRSSDNIGRKNEPIKIRGAAHRNIISLDMANTYTQCYIHLVFSPKNRAATIGKQWKNELEKYISAIITNNGHKLLAIGTMPDHIHIFIGYNVNQLIPTLVAEIKTSTNHWINTKKLTLQKFDWQRGYGAFSHSPSQIDGVVQYILSQEQHHQKQNFREEYLKILNKNGVDFDENYIFDFFE
jgi:REP element-mobilizing transposase RayT